MSIETFGSGERLRIAADLLGKRFVSRELVLLPVPTTRDKTHISGTEIPLSEVAQQIEGGALCVGYGLPLDFATEVKRLSAEVLDLSEDENYLKDNAWLTALGAVGYILTTDGCAVSDMRVGIVGYGRIGELLVRILSFLGAKVRVYSTSPEKRRTLGALGVESSPLDGLFSDADGTHILINTAPTDLSPYVFGRGYKRIVELASGKNFEGVAGVEYLPSLPEKMFPISAGQSYYKAVMRHIQGGGGL